MDDSDWKLLTPEEEAEHRKLVRDARELGRKIYMEALSDRRGFRADQIGIDDPDIWAEIFEDIGSVAISAIPQKP
jgi:hypothetical protein